MADTKFIAVTYRLYTNESDKTPKEEATEKQPFVFLSELGMALDPFEEKVKTLADGEEFDFTIACEEAYGMPDQERVVALPRGIFEIDGKFDDEHIKVGSIVPMNNADGQRLLGKVQDITDENVLMDFNHPYAGSDLHFVGKVIENRPATDDELKQAIRLISGEGGCGGGHCGGNCGGSCGGGCKDGGGCEGGCEGDCEGGCEGDCKDGDCNCGK